MSFLSRSDDEHSKLNDTLSNKKSELGRIKDGEECCAVCGGQISLMHGYGKLRDGSLVCGDCIKRAGVPAQLVAGMGVEEFSKRADSMAALRAAYRPTKRPCSELDIDEVHKGFRIKSGLHANVYQYQDLLSFELEEDNETVSSGGVGRAIAGGVLFGPGGAVVGAMTGKKRTKNYCESMQVRISLKCADPDVVYLTFIEKKTKTKSSDYKKAVDAATKCMTALEQVAAEVGREDDAGRNAASAAQGTRQLEQAVPEGGSAADEILKYKQLADAGIITQEEFEQAKRKLLGL